LAVKVAAVVCPEGGACRSPASCRELGQCCRQDDAANVGPMQQGVVRHGLTTDSDARKAAPIATGVLDYFPDALADVARLSKIGNDKHNPGEPLHWARGKSNDQADCILRHMIDRGTIDTDGVLHDAKVAWRALAQLQLAIELIRATGVQYPPPAPVDAAENRGAWL
jgi:hypothetical protein